MDMLCCTVGNHAYSVHRFSQFHHHPALPRCLQSSSIPVVLSQIFPDATIFLHHPSGYPKCTLPLRYPRPYHPPSFNTRRARDSHRFRNLHRQRLFEVWSRRTSQPRCAGIILELHAGVFRARKPHWMLRVSEDASVLGFEVLGLRVCHHTCTSKFHGAGKWVL